MQHSVRRTYLINAFSNKLRKTKHNIVNESIPENGVRAIDHDISGGDASAKEMILLIIDSWNINISLPVWMLHANK